MLRLSPADGGRLQEATGLDAVVAGAEANVAAALASLGVATAWVSALPDNPLGAAGRRRSLRRAGVELEFVEWDPSGRLGLFFVEFGSPPRADHGLVRPRGIGVQRHADASGLGPRGGRLRGHLRNHARALRFRPRPRPRLPRRGQGGGRPTCLDVNYRERLSSPEDAARPAGPVVADVDVLVCSRRDAERVFSITADSAADVAVALREQVAPDAELVAITDGERGAAAASADEARRERGPADVRGRSDRRRRRLSRGPALGAARGAAGSSGRCGTAARLARSPHRRGRPGPVHACEVRAVADEERVLIR